MYYILSSEKLSDFLFWKGNFVKKRLDLNSNKLKTIFTCQEEVKAWRNRFGCFPLKDFPIDFHQADTIFTFFINQKAAPR